MEKYIGEAPFSPAACVATVFAMAVTVLAICAVAVQTLNPGVFGYLLPCLLIEGLVGMKFMAPRVPWSQLVICCSVVFAVHGLADHFASHFPPLYPLGELVIQGTCVFGFGWRWVAKRYIPVSSNMW